MSNDVLNNELESVNIAIKRLTDVLEKQSRFAHVEWGRDQLRLITMDLQELMNIRKSLLNEIKKIEDES